MNLATLTTIIHVVVAIMAATEVEITVTTEVMAAAVEAAATTIIKIGMVVTSVIVISRWAQ